MMEMTIAVYTTLRMSNAPPSTIIHAVRVVPMFAPMMTLMACDSVSNPAETKDTVITVVAVEDCTLAVMNVPVRRLVTRLVVIVASTFRNLEPAIFCSPSLITFMPYMSRATHPTRTKNPMGMFLGFDLRNKMSLSRANVVKSFDFKR
jgi:hypothetical protein